MLEVELSRREIELEEREDALADDAERLMSIESRLEQRERGVLAWSEDEEEESSDDDETTIEPETTPAHKPVSLQSLNNEFHQLVREAMLKSSDNLPALKRMTQAFKNANSGADSQLAVRHEMVEIIKSRPELTEKYRSLVDRQRQAQNSSS